MQSNRKPELSDIPEPGEILPPAHRVPPTNQNASHSPARSLPVLSVVSEVFPLIKTGGLADVTGALPKALAVHNVQTRILMPAYAGIIERCGKTETICGLTLLGHEVSVLGARCESLDLLLLHCPALFDRRGGPYLDEAGHDHHDNWLRFAVLSLAAANIAANGIGGWYPAIVHLHDWQAALTACYMRAQDTNVPIVLTIHNLAFQGQFSAGVFSRLDLSDRFLSVDCLEYHHDISFLKAGIQLSDAVTTVSPTYAREILTEEQGMGMAGVLQTRRTALSGIINGVDQSVWNPRTDTCIPMNYDEENIGTRRANRQTVERQFGLTSDEGPIVAVISRLTWQKGIDMLASVVPGIIDRCGKLVVMGDGDPAIVFPLLEKVRHHSGRMAVQVGYSEQTAHLLHAGSDMVLQPSRFEPCGLTQLYALRYGAIPVVARTGGLAETVVDANEAATATGSATGFHFNPGSIDDLYNALDRAFVTYGEPERWRQLQRQAMRTDFGWDRSAEQYARLYRRLLSSRSDAQQRNILFRSGL